MSLLSPGCQGSKLWHDAAGVVVERYDYTTYGATTTYDDLWAAPQTTSRVGNPFAYTGLEWDTETGLYHYRARTYHPVLGRFNQRDPLGYVDGPGLYEYVRCGPVAATDPLGMSSGNMGHHPLPQSILMQLWRLEAIADDALDYGFVYYYGEQSPHHKAAGHGRYNILVARSIAAFGKDKGAMLKEQIRSFIDALETDPTTKTPLPGLTEVESAEVRCFNVPLPNFGGHRVKHA